VEAAIVGTTWETTIRMSAYNIKVFKEKWVCSGFSREEKTRAHGEKGKIKERTRKEEPTKYL